MRTTAVFKLRFSLSRFAIFVRPHFVLRVVFVVVVVACCFRVK